MVGNGSMSLVLGVTSLIRKTLKNSEKLGNIAKPETQDVSTAKIMKLVIFSILLLMKLNNVSFIIKLIRIKKNLGSALKPA